MRQQRGSNLSQYAIIIALVALVLIPSFFLIGQNLMSIFQNQESAFNHMSDQAAENSTLNNSILPDIKAGSLNGTPDNPYNICTNSECTMDFGTFSLSGIPENFNEIVETSGTSSGTDKLADLLDQIASQLALNNKPDEALKIRKLANTGHNIASVERTFEGIIKDCNYDEACIRSYDDKPFPKPADFDDSFGSFPEGFSYYNINHSTDLEDAYDFYVNGKGSAEDEKWFKDNFSSDFINQYQDVMKDSNIPDEIRGVVQELVFDISDTGTGFHRLYDDNFNSSGLQEYNAAKVTDIDSALICGAGWSEDSGTKCE